MEIIVFLSIVIAALAVLTSIVLVRRVKKQIAEMTDALVDVKNGNGNRRILSATNELTAPLAYEINADYFNERYAQLLNNGKANRRDAKIFEDDVNGGKMRLGIDKICEALDCTITDLLEYIPNERKTTGKYLILEEHGNRKQKKEKD